MTTAKFALRTTPEIKAAAVAMAATYLSEKNPNGTYSALHCGSINDAFNVMLSRGAKNIEAIARENLQEENKQLLIFQDMMRFFLDNPAAENVLPVNLPEASPAKVWLAELLELQPEDFPTGGDRGWVADELNMAQSRVLRLTGVIGAVQKIGLNA